MAILDLQTDRWTPNVISSPSSSISSSPSASISASPSASTSSSPSSSISSSPSSSISHSISASPSSSISTSPSPSISASPSSSISASPSPSISASPSSSISHSISASPSSSISASPSASISSSISASPSSSISSSPSSSISASVSSSPSTSISGSPSSSPSASPSISESPSPSSSPSASPSAPIMLDLLTDQWLIADPNVTIDEYNNGANASTRRWKMIIEVYFDGDDAQPTIFLESNIVRWQLLEEAQAEGSTPLGAVSANEFIFILNNIARDFTPSNTSSPYYGKLLPNILVKAYIRLMLPVSSSTSYYQVHLGNYRTKDWTSPTNTIETTVVCYDDIYILGQKPTPQLPTVESVNLQQITKNLLMGLNLDLTDFEIDEFLQEIAIGWFLNGKVLDNLQLLANRGFGAIYGKRDETIKFRAYKNLEVAKYYFNDTNQIVNADLPQVYYNTYSRVSVQYYTPYVGETTTLLDIEVTVPPGTLTLERLAVSGPVGIYEGISVIYASDTTIGSMSAGANDLTIELINSGSDDETVTLVVKGKKVEYNESYVEVEDSDMISKIGEVTLEIQANHLVQNKTSATNLANYILQIVKEPTGYVNMEIMGNPAILLTSTINVNYPNAHINDIDIVPLRIEHEFDGGLSGRIYGIKKSIKETT